MMRLLLPVPTSWEVREAPGRDLYLVVSTPPQVTVEVGPMVLRADLPSDLLTRGLRPGERMDGVREIDHRTRTGWPMRLRHGVIVDGAGHVLESRLVVSYEFVIFATAIMVRCADPAAFDAHKDQIVQVLEQGRPSLHRDTPAAIAELYSLEESP